MRNTTDTTATGLNETWQAAVHMLLAQTMSELVRTDDGWSIDLGFSADNAAQILALLPGEYDRRAEHWEEMIDGSGECVDYESESGVYACDAQRAIFAFTDHWQAPLSGVVTIHDSEDAYRRALAAALASYAEEEVDA